MIDEFIAWYSSERRLSFNKSLVTRYRIHLESCQLAPARSTAGSQPSGSSCTKLLIPAFLARTSLLGGVYLSKVQAYDKLQRARPARLECRRETT